MFRQRIDSGSRIRLRASWMTPDLLKESLAKKPFTKGEESKIPNQDQFRRSPSDSDLLLTFPDLCTDSMVMTRGLSE